VLSAAVRRHQAAALDQHRVSPISSPRRTLQEMRLQPALRFQLWVLWFPMLADEMTTTTMISTTRNFSSAFFFCPMYFVVARLIFALPLSLF
jgi:hypothetical protein